MVKQSDTTRSDKQALYSNIFNDFERLANQSQDGIYHFDTVAQRFLFYNQRFQTFFQLEDKPAVETSTNQIFSAVHTEDRRHVLKAFGNSLKPGKTGGSRNPLVQRSG